MSFFSWLRDALTSLEHDAEKEIVIYAEPAIAFIKANGGKTALTLAEGVLTAVAAGTPWGELLSAFATQASAAGISLAEGAGGAILNYAQSNLIAQGKLPAPPAA